jgi:hypothetical protein
MEELESLWQQAKQQEPTVESSSKAK